LDHRPEPGGKAEGDPIPSAGEVSPEKVVRHGVRVNLLSIEDSSRRRTKRA